MVHDATTEIGCAYKVCEEKNRMQIMCLYDDIGHIDGMVLYETGKACEQHEDCTSFKDSHCNNWLCVKPKEEPDNGENTICEEGNDMTDMIRTTILDMHNRYRSLVAKGKAENNKGYAPKAANMKKLKYDCGLEKIAVAHAQNCMSEHSDDSEREGAGENLYSISINKADKLKTAERACRTWFGELKQVGVGSKNLFNPGDPKRPGKIGHYTQMVWGTTEYIGCGITNCPDKTLIVCNYNATGNYKKQPIYEVGETCSNCPSGYHCTDEKLCSDEQN